MFFYIIGFYIQEGIMLLFNKKELVLYIKGGTISVGCEKLLHINKLGGFSIQYGDVTISEQKKQSKKMWRLLEFLIVNRKREISQNEIFESLWGEENLINPAAALKTLIFRVRKLLEELNYKDGDLIVHNGESYAWNNETKVLVDVDLFEELYNKSSYQTGTEKKDLYLEIINLYRGDFLPKSSFEHWVIPIKSYYHSLYLTIVHKIIKLLEQEREFILIIEICQKAIKIDQFDDKIHYAMIEALSNFGYEKQALEHYNYTMDLLYNQLGVTPSNQFKTLYKELFKSNNSVESNLEVIADNLKEVNEEGGAFYCEYEFFKDIYRLETRGLQRNENSVLICLLTLYTFEGKSLGSKVLTKSMDELFLSIQNSLRQVDVYSRYSNCQYIIMIPHITNENGNMIMERIKKRFYKQYNRKDILLNYKFKLVTS